MGHLDDTPASQEPGIIVDEEAESLEDPGVMDGSKETVFSWHGTAEHV